ncbi:unnamed protein product [Caenorhabditis brenneri]
MSNQSTERYLIVGGGGYLGAKLISQLQKNGHRGIIVVLDPNPQKFKTIKLRRVKYIKGSFQDDHTLERALRKVKAVFHLAAVGHTGLTAADRESVFEFNVKGTRDLVEKCKKSEVKRFHYASSVAVAFVGKELSNAKETDPQPRPEEFLDYYSASKAEAEKFVLEQSNENFKTSSLRFRNIYGPEDPNVTRKVADLIGRGLFIAMISKYGREAVSNGSSATNCAKGFVLAEKELKKSGGHHGQFYYITDKEIIGQYSFWKSLVVSKGRRMPALFIPYKLMAWINPVIEMVCYRWLKVAPLMTDFELAIVSTDNTYSCDKARDHLGYYAEPNEMEKVAAYYNQMKPRQDGTWTTVIGFSVAVLFVSIILAYFYFF